MNEVIGVDVGKKHCQACIMDEEGTVLDEFSFTNTFNDLERLLEQIGGENYKAVLESTGNLWPRIYEALDEHGVEMSS